MSDAFLAYLRVSDVNWLEISVISETTLAVTQNAQKMECGRTLKLLPPAKDVLDIHCHDARHVLQIVVELADVALRARVIEPALESVNRRI